MSQVDLRAVTKSFQDDGAPVVRSVDLTIADGERFVIVGPSGSGKTTLLRLIAGLDAPTSGEVGIAGASMNGVAPRHRGVGMVFQNPALYPHLTVRENLGFGLRARQASRAEVVERVGETARWLGLADHLERRPRELSGGERQRVALGRAIATRPAVLLLDEPFAGLDAPLRAATRAVVLHLHRTLKTTMILVTHDQDDALAVGDRVAVMRRGAIEQVGRPVDLHDQPANRFVAGFLGEPAMAFLPCRIEAGRLEIETGQWSLEAQDAPGGSRAAWLGLRPEAVVVDPAESAGGRLARTLARLDRIEPRGHEAIAWLRVGECWLAARVSPRFDRRPGEPVAIGIDLGQGRWFARDGREERLD